eukprot:PITA_26781
MEVKLCDQVVSILIDPGSNYIYISFDLVDKCCLNKEVNVESWLVQLATSTKKRVCHWIRYCEFELNVMSTSAHLNVLPLGSYNMFLGMDWLYIHKTKAYCYEKAIECFDDDGEKRNLQVHISSDKGKDVEYVEVLKRYPVLQQLQHVFPIEISELLPHREVDISIELMSGATPSSKAPYKMSTPELVELKLQIKKCLIRDTLSQVCRLGVHQCCL